MTNSNKKTFAFTLTGAAPLIISAVLTFAVLTIFSACPNNAGGSGNNTGSGSSGGGGVTPPAPSTDKTYTVDGVSFTLKNIDAVSGKNIGHTDQGDNPPHPVSISAYYIGETEVTQELWSKVMSGNPSNFTGKPKNPVEKVSWLNCIVFCNELTKKVTELGAGECVYYKDAAFSTAYTAADAASNTIPHAKWTAKGFRLPTEAEWEWAALGGTQNKWAGTNEKAQLKNYAWYVNTDGGDANNTTHEIGTKTANGYGLRDMSGNVQEWCWDIYDNNLPNPLPPDYTGAASGTDRVARGGNWGVGSNDAACSYRTAADQEASGASENIGLRVVRRL